MGKSSETLLHNVTTHIENAIEYKDIALGAFLDIEGAFDTLELSAERHGIEQMNLFYAGK
jgi:hypothetical protein